MVGFGIFDGILGNLNRVAVALLSVDRNVDLAAEHFKLFDGRRTVDVAGHQKRAFGFLAFELLGYLAREGGFARTLESRHEDHRGVARKIDLRCLAAHEPGEFVVDNLHHHLAGFDGCQHVLSERFLLYGVSEVLGHFIVYVGVKQRAAYVFKRFGHIYLGDLALSLQELEASFESFAKIFKHVGGSVVLEWGLTVVGYFTSRFVSVSGNITVGLNVRASSMSIMA